MSRLNKRSIIFALSNPTDKAECSAEQAYTWSKGKALYAAGVQSADVTVGGTTFHPGQVNNFYIFPAIGLATYAARPRPPTPVTVTMPLPRTRLRRTLRCRSSIAQRSRRCGRSCTAASRSRR
jgi:malic enzyme